MGWKCNSVVKHLVSMWKALGLMGGEVGGWDRGDYLVLCFIKQKINTKLGYFLF
jgi:hypothetical protein